ncbi:MAG: high-potential iron-sulfur protein [Betaproteobacteria bacterium]|nr:high-potential iron-sulfur protein [Betaproteobacteria bacterium]
MMATHDPKRRAVLRAALTAGCMLCLPAVGRARSGKVSKAQAKYQDTPKGNQNCAKCLHFVAADSTCKVVEGKVSPQGWCQLWAAKQG